MRFRISPSLSLVAVGAALIVAVAPAATAVTPQQESAAARSEGTPLQRLEVMRQQLEALRRNVNGAISGLKEGEKKDDKTAAAASLEDPRTRLKGLEKEAAALLSEVSNLRGKQERAEKYDASDLDRVETTVGELRSRTETALRETVGARRADVSGQSAAGEKKKRGLFGRLLGRGDDPEYQPLIDTVAPGRDRELFEEAAKYVRKSNYETARLLFSVIVNTYPDSDYLPLAKLATADSFYREGTTSALIQAAAAYRDWLTFFPTDPLADDVMLKMAEAEMRQMGLADRDISHATKAEVQLKAIMQTFPKTSLREDIQQRLNEVQENLGMHNLQIARFYYARNENNKGGLKGAQSRFLEITKKYPNFSYMDEVLYKLGTTYMMEEEPDEASKYYAQIARDYPNGEYAEKAKEQLGVIGAPVPEADPIKKSLPPQEHPSFTSSVLREVMGTPDVTVSKDGVLIKSDDDENDLLKIAIERNGVLPAEYLENPGRRPPARVGPAPVITAPAGGRPAPNTTTTPTTPPARDSGPAPYGEPAKDDPVTIRPTRPGAPAGSAPIGSPAAAPNTPPVTTPATTTPNTPTAPSSAPPATTTPTAP